jgi:hypothetical protein
MPIIHVMKSHYQILTAVRLFAAVVILWGISGALTAANAHQPVDTTANEMASENMLDKSNSERAADEHDKDSWHCAGSGSMCHGFAAIFNGQGATTPDLGGAPQSHLIERQSSRLIAPLHKPPIEELNACF